VFNPLRWYSHRSTTVLLHLLEAIGKAARHTSDDALLAALPHQAQLIARAAQAGLCIADNQRQVARCLQQVLATIADEAKLAQAAPA
jgi:uncharacterized membrane protein